MAGYNVPMTRTLSTTLSLGVVSADATRARRLKMDYYNISCTGDPANGAQIEGRIRRSSAAGTSTSVVPRPNDLADFVTEFDAGENLTVEPTYTAATEQLRYSFNQRSQWQWYAPPGGEIVVPATAAAGIGFETPSINTGTPIIVGTAHIVEQ